MALSAPSNTAAPTERFAYYEQVGQGLKLRLSKGYLESVANQPTKGIEEFCEDLKSFIRDHQVGISLSAGLGGGVLAALTINHIIIGLPVLALHSIALSAVIGCLLMVGIYQAIAKDPWQGLVPSSNRLLNKMAPECLGRLESLTANLTETASRKTSIDKLYEAITPKSDELPELYKTSATYQVAYDNAQQKSQKADKTTLKTCKDSLDQHIKSTKSLKREAYRDIIYIENSIRAHAKLVDASTINWLKDFDIKFCKVEPGYNRLEDLIMNTMDYPKDARVFNEIKTYLNTPGRFNENEINQIKIALDKLNIQLPTAVELDEQNTESAHEPTQEQIKSTSTSINLDSDSRSIHNRHEDNELETDKTSASGNNVIDELPQGSLNIAASADNRNSDNESTHSHKSNASKSNRSSASNEVVDEDLQEQPDTTNTPAIPENNADNNA